MVQQKEREGYYQYMLRRYREDEAEIEKVVKKSVDLNFKTNFTESAWKREIADLTKIYYVALNRIKELTDENEKLKKEVKNLKNADLYNN